MRRAARGVRLTERPALMTRLACSRWPLTVSLLSVFLYTLPVHSLENRSAAALPYLAPEHVQGATTINADEAWLLFRSGMMFVDVRLPADYMAGRVPEAHSLTIMRDPDHPGDSFQRDRLLDIAGALDTPMVIYCNERDCWRSEAAITRAREWGFTNLYFFPGGFPEWVASGYPFE